MNHSQNKQEKIVNCSLETGLEEQTMEITVVKALSDKSDLFILYLTTKPEGKRSE